MKTFSILLALLITSISYGQGNLAVSKIEKLDIKGFNLQFSPDGNKLLFTSNNFKGLKLYDILQKTIKEISNEAGAGYQPAIIGDDVVFKTKAKKNQLQSFNVTSGKQTSLDKSLKFNSPKSYAVSQLDNSALATASSDLRSIELRDKIGNKKIVVPLGYKTDYINVSLSPDHSKLLFRVSGQGSFVSDLEGNIIKELGNVEFPKWIDNETVLYTITKDDGHQYLSSKLFVSNIRDASKPQPISTPSYIVLYPKYNATQNKIVFNTPTGDVVLLSLKR